MTFDVQAARELVERKRRTHQCAFTANTLQEACDEIERLRDSRDKLVAQTRLRADQAEARLAAAQAVVEAAEVPDWDNGWPYCRWCGMPLPDSQEYKDAVHAKSCEWAAYDATLPPAQPAGEQQ